MSYVFDIVFVDINECEDGNNGGCTLVCSNTVGSYNCDCNEGYNLLNDGTTCEGKSLILLYLLKAPF